MLPIPNAGQVDAVQKALAKLGKASVTVTRVPEATDLSFSERPPHCHVTLMATDPADSKFSKKWECDLFGKEAPNDTYTFVIPAKKGQLPWGKGRKLNIHIVADPNQGFQDSHEPMTIDLEGVVTGDAIKRTVSLRPKSEGGQQSQSSEPPDKKLHV
ncbi:MAG: hypothetical protein ACLQKA_01855 [Bryobacteraceae bacterium]